MTHRAIESLTMLEAERVKASQQLGEVPRAFEKDMRQHAVTSGDTVMGHVGANLWMWTQASEDLYSERMLNNHAQWLERQ